MSCFSSKYFNRCITLALSYGWQTENFQHFLVLMRSKYVRMSDNTRKWQTVSLDSSLAPHKHRKSFNNIQFRSTLYTTVRTPTRSDQRRSLVVSSFATFAKIFFCKNSFEVFLTASLLQLTYIFGLMSTAWNYWKLQTYLYIHIKDYTYHSIIPYLRFGSLGVCCPRRREREKNQFNNTPPTPVPHLPHLPPTITNNFLLESVPSWPVWQLSRAEVTPWWEFKPHLHFYMKVCRYWGPPLRLGTVTKLLPAAFPHLTRCHYMPLL